MKLLIDFFPIIAFFVAFKIYGIYVATAVAIIINILQVIGEWFMYRRCSPLQIISLALIVIMGGSTLLMHNELFIKWKPTVLYWILACVFLGSRFFGNRPLIQRLMATHGFLNLPQATWNNLNLSWILFFIAMGFANLYVIYHFSTNAWVNFKLFGLLGLTILFSIAQMLFLIRYVRTSLIKSDS